jgi:hypothetical protein
MSPAPSAITAWKTKKLTEKRSEKHHQKIDVETIHAGRSARTGIMALMADDSTDFHLFRMVPA